jgi:hypothetical protein
MHAALSQQRFVSTTCKVHARSHLTLSHRSACMHATLGQEVTTFDNLTLYDPNAARCHSNNPAAVTVPTP